MLELFFFYMVMVKIFIWESSLEWYEYAFCH